VNHDQIESIGHRSTRYLKVLGGTVSTPPVMRRAPASEFDVEEVRRIVHPSDNIYGKLVSFDDKAALIRANFIEGRLDYQKLFDQINDQIIKPYEDASVKISVAGEPRLYGWIYDYAGEVTVIFTASVVILWVLLYIYFKDWRGALRPTITGGVSAIWGLGFMHLFGFALDPLALVIPFFVTARAVSHSVQMHDRYYEEYHIRNWNKEQAIIYAFSGLFVPTMSGIVTDALGMLVMIAVPVLILQRIAVSASVWVMSVAISELLLNPVVYYYLKPPHQTKVLAREGGLFQRTIARPVVHILSAKGKRITVGVWVVLVLLAATQWAHITIGDPTAASPLLYLDSPYNQAHGRIQGKFGGVEPLIIVVEGKEAALKDPRVLETMEDFQRYMEVDPVVGYSFSLADVIRAIQMTFYDQQPRWAVIPTEFRRISTLFFYFFAGSPPSETAKYADPSFSNSHVTFFCKNHQGDNVKRLIDRARTFIAQNPMENANFRLAGGLIGVTAGANEEIVRNDILMNLLGFGTIFITVVITYRSWMAAVLMMVPLLMANGLVNAYMGWRNIGINIQSLPIVTVGVGFGIDYGLYVVSRVVEEYQVKPDLEWATASALKSAGKAVTFTAVSLVAVTLIWAFSRIRFDAEMGLLLALWMGVSFLSSVTLLPALLVMVRPRFIVREAERATAPVVPAMPEMEVGT
jgi:predicted RND superfamily exporter protein